MARGESPYQGRYVVPDVDFSGIERGGAAWGEAFKGIGQAVEKYGLKKEEKKQTESKLKASVQALDMWSENEIITPDQAAQIKEFVDDPANSSNDKLAFLQEHERNIIQVPKIINAKLAAELAEREGELGELDQANKIHYQGIGRKLADMAFDKKEKLHDPSIQAELDSFAVTGVNRRMVEEGFDDHMSILQSQAKTAKAGAAGAKLQLSVDKAVVEIWGGPDQYADFKMQMSKLEKASAESMNSYRDMMGQAAIFDKLAKLNPSLKDQLTPINSVIDMLQTSKTIPVTIDGTKQTVSLNDYEAMHRDNPDKYPWTGHAAKLAGTVAAQSRLMGQIVDSQQVQAITTPPGATDEPKLTTVEGKPLGEMSIEEAQQLIPQLEASKQKLLQERDGLTKKGAIRPRPKQVQVPSYSSWGGDPLTSPIALGTTPSKTQREDVPVDLNYIKKRNQEIENKINSINADIERINQYIPSNP